ncbi:stromal membrane-associated protein 1-like isoform X2 [Solea solea]|uniref:stromal membrane-associated protein 1-like isoform X2 n=1 Tax=Solea solea TaxID=90069 RepID=UPI00272CA73F|nr:stromal membrane-associated protein 1-like isoform X2 [Solea solea]
MTTRSEREKAQKLNEQHQAILSKLLREQDNKFCADCEAKGPRWASWNLGVFICIRCAGIHRNLGVHISRVKSVNLDQWTHEQIQSMVDMGNSRGKQLYEAHLPESFRRPQTDQAVEVFIRDKYERKKYFDEKGLTTPPMSECRASPKKSPEPTVDLLGLDAPEGGGKSPSSNELDIFGPMVSNPLPSANNTQKAQSGSGTAPPQPDPSSTSTSSSSSTSTTATTKAEEKKLLSKDSILSLYASSSVGAQPQSQQQPAAGQGVYMGQFMGGCPMMSSMALPNGSYVGIQQQQQQQQQQSMMAANQGQNTYHMQQQQQQQQGQWNMSQMTQQMSGMAVSGGESAPGGPAAGWPPAPPTASGQTLSTQLWK